jgi:hypothetical protein
VYRNCCIGHVGEGARVVARVVLVGVGDVQKAGGSRAEDVGLHTATHTHKIYLLFLPTIYENRLRLQPLGAAHPRCRLQLVIRPCERRRLSSMIYFKCAPLASNALCADKDSRAAVSVAHSRDLLLCARLFYCARGEYEASTLE